MLEDGSRGANWYCHCEVFTREHVCEGVLATQLLLKEVILPLSAAAFKGRKIRGPGAPRNITKKQRYAHVESEESEDVESEEFEAYAGYAGSSPFDEEGGGDLHGHGQQQIGGDAYVQAARDQDS